ncbi:MAG: hypothetical protein LBB31_01055, partial [Prevotellaceae bacterium]|nr:hypothetical protein [Prevotellaceae bacterium]
RKYRTLFFNSKFYFAFNKNWLPQNEERLLLTAHCLLETTFASLSISIFFYTFTPLYEITVLSYFFAYGTV